MTQKEKYANYLYYIDDEGSKFEMVVLKHFINEERNYVLASQCDQHIHEGKDCSCHEKKHRYTNNKDPEGKILYVFELLQDIQGEKLIPVKDEKLQELSLILDTLL